MIVARKKIMFGSRRRRPNAAEVAEVHRDNLRKNLEHRIEVARSKGDTNLVQMLEAEYRYLR
jgi:hypothetical protein